MVASLISQKVKIFGAPPGAAGIQVTERIDVSRVDDAALGTVSFIGILKRGPMGVPIPISTRAEYDNIFGKPGDKTWHLYTNSAHLTPDAIDGFFTNSGETGRVWVIRNEVDAKAKKASLTLRNRIGANVLRFEAANPGRWGGYSQVVPWTPIVVSTARTFTIIAPSAKANEFVGAKLLVSSVTGKSFPIIANTEADPETGEVIFTVSSQFNLLSEGVSGSISLSGGATYRRTISLTGTISFATTVPISGTVNINGTRVVGGGTAFNTQLQVGRNVYFNNEARTVISITSATTMTIDEPFSVPVNNATLERDNLVVNGTGTNFTLQLEVGDDLIVTVGGQTYVRDVASIQSATRLTLSSGFPVDVSAGTSASIRNFWVEGTTSDYGGELTPGNFIFDPNQAGATIKVVDVDASAIPEKFKVEKQFSADFTNEELVKQNQLAYIDLDAPPGTGLSVEVGQGIRFPQTHFSLSIDFDGSRVLFIEDASLDPSDPLFVEPLVNDGRNNIAYRTGAKNFQAWVTVRSLFAGSYTTDADSDVRPSNGAGRILHLTTDRLYTVASFDYAAAIGNFVYPNPYQFARSRFRVKGAVAPITLQGSISSNGFGVIGTSTNFLSVLRRGDYLYNTLNGEARQIASVVSNTSLRLESAFSSNLPAGTKAIKSGYLQVDRGIDLTAAADVGDRFFVVYPQYFGGGYDGNTAALIPYYFTRYFDTDTDVLGNAVRGKNQGLIRIACPGISDITIQKAGIQYADAVAYEYRAEIPSQYTNAASVESFINQELGRSNAISISYPSYGTVINPLGGGERFIPLSGHIMGRETAYASTYEGYHWTPAGSAAILNGIIKLPIEVTPAQEAILNLAGVQSIKYVDGNPVIWGARSPVLDDIFKWVALRRTQSQYIHLFQESRALQSLIFRPNQPELSWQIYLLVKDFARREFNRGVYSRYLSFEQAVTISLVTPQSAGQAVNSQRDLDALLSILNGQLGISYSYVFASPVERVNIIVGPNGALALLGG